MIELISNHDFSGGTTGWTNSGGSWGGTAQPNVISNLLRFTYVSRTVSQVATISNISLTERFDIDLSISKNSNKTAAQSLIFYEATFRRSNNTTVASVRDPASGNRNNLTNTLTSFPSQLTREEVGSSFNEIDNVLLQITAYETGNWAGQYGPNVDYASIIAVLMEQQEINNSVARRYSPFSPIMRRPRINWENYEL